ncbi:MAG: DUF2007 domain-containing protein [Chromatiales bacterium]|jgi:hypothetical protein
MQRLYEARDRIEAQLLVDHLGAYGIRAVILGDYLSGAAGELSALVFPAVWLVEDRDLGVARRRLEEFLERLERAPARADWVCPACGTELEGAFDVCWHCGRPRPGC